MQPTLYIHLGQQKTGTTSFQRFCTQYRQELVSRFGILYPTPPADPWHRHASLFPFRQDRWRAVKREADASGCTRILISNENLSVTGLKNDDLNAIRKLFPEFAIACIVYLRRMDEACREWYMQTYKRDNMLDTSYADYVEKQLKNKSFRLFPTRLLDKCAEQVGKENLLIRLYDQSGLLRGNVVDDMFSLLGVTLPESMDREKKYNPGIPAQALPCLTDTLRRFKINDPTRVMIYRKIASAYQWRDSPPVKEGYLPALQKEVEAVEAYVPGYRALFEKKGPDLSFPQSNMSPQELLTIDLLYTVLFELRKRNTRFLLLREFFAQKGLPWVKKGLHSLRTLPAGLREIFSSRGKR